MLAELRATEPVVGETFDEADRVMAPLLGRPLSEIVFADPSDPAALARAEEDLKQTAVTQPAVLTVDTALTRLLASYGIRPDMVMGHSLGDHDDVLPLFTNHPKVGEIVSFNQALCGLYAAGLGTGASQEPAAPAATAPSTLTVRPPTAPTAVLPADRYAQRVVQLRRRGLVYPYELIRTLTSAGGQARSGFPPGDFTEHDLDGDRLVPVERPYGENTANLVVGVVRNFTVEYPEGITRVVLASDPSRNLGSLAEPECRRIIAALDLAERLGVPLEWFAVSSGARISMDSGTENMDWIARVLRRLVEFTQGRGEVNVIVDGINVGAQPYWDAEATMLMHTRGILVMTPNGAMVLTGKQALDYSGGVSAEDNHGIGGYESIMGPNGQAQYWAPDLAAACQILLRHYEHTYSMSCRASGSPGARRPPPTRSTATSATTRSPATAPASPASARSSRTRPTPAASGRSTSAGSCPGWSTPTTNRWSAGPGCATRRPPWYGTPGLAAGRSRSSASSHGRCRGTASFPPTVPTSGHRGRCSRARPRRSRGRSTRPAATARWWCSPTCPASTGRRSRCASSSSSTARRSAGRW